MIYSNNNAQVLNERSETSVKLSVSIENLRNGF